MTEHKSECCGADIVEDFDAIPFGASKEYKCSKCELHYASPSPESKGMEEWETRLDTQLEEVILDQDVRTIVPGIKSFIRQLLTSARQEQSHNETREEEIEKLIDRASDESVNDSVLEPMSKTGAKILKTLIRQTINQVREQARQETESKGMEEMIENFLQKADLKGKIGEMMLKNLLTSSHQEADQRVAEAVEQERERVTKMFMELLDNYYIHSPFENGKPILSKEILCTLLKNNIINK